MKAIIALCLRRPVTVVAAYVLVVVLAVVAFWRVPVALLPDLRYPGLVVWTAYPDVPPERVEQAVTERIEEAVAGTAGLERLTARSLLGGSLVRLDFGWNANLDLALLDVREQLDRLGEGLPEAAERPVVLRLDPSDRPILMIALQGLDADPTPQALADLKQIGREVVARRLEQLDDVARVRVTGGYERRVEVVLDPDRLAAHGLSIDALAAVLRAANVALPGGLIRRGPFRYAVEVSGEFTTTADVAEAVVARAGGQPVHLRDVAQVRDGVAERRGLVRFDGAETLLLLVERRPDANTVRAAREVRAALAELEADLPGVRLTVVVDESRFIEQAIGGVAQAVLLGGVLALAILFVFLRRPRVLVAVAVAVPLSLALTLILFEAFSVTFNLISLSGLALGVGMLVDNAIVVVENITRLREAGRPPYAAALEGTAEVASAIAASTFTTVAVFLPLTFVEGLAGRLFRDQSVAVVCSLGASLLVALTAVPLVAARERRPDAATPAAAPARRPDGPLLRTYERALAWSLDHRAVVLGACVLGLAATAALGLALPREVVPPTDQGRLLVHLSAPPEVDLPVLDARAAAIEAAARRGAGVAHVLADLGERDEARLDLEPRPPYEGTLTLLLAPEQEAVEALEALRTLPLPPDVAVDVRPVPTQLEALLAPDAADLLIDLTGETRAAAEAAAVGVLAALQAEPALRDARRAEAGAVPAYRLTFRRDALARFGVTPGQLAAYLEAAARGRTATALRTVDEAVPIVLRAAHAGGIEALLAEPLPAAGALLPLSTFVEAVPVMLPAGLWRTGQAPIVRLAADVAPGAGLAAATAAVEAVLAERLPPRVRAHVGGATDAFRDGLRAVGWSLALSLLLVYLILAAQFESLVQPLVVLTTVPLAAFGVVLALLLTGQTVNLMSLTGAVVLVGIVVNDAIIKVDFINQRRGQGMALRAAIEAAGHDRVRPIMMTTLTTVLGLLPLALGLGAGAELQAPLAIALVGGLLSATLLTLVVVPVLYSLAARAGRGPASA